MISFEKLIRLKLFTAKFKMFFLKGNFKRYGNGASILFPLRIRGARFIEIGKKVFIYDNSRILVFGDKNSDSILKIEDGANIGRFVHIVAVNKVTIKKNVLIADKVYISDNSHEYADINIPVMHQPVQFKGEVSIGENSWIGENVCILGASVGRHSIIGANSIVLNDIDDYCVAVGNPAKVIKKYDHHQGKWVSTKLIK